MPERRKLDSFAPFRPDEIIESKFKNRDTGKDEYEYYPCYAGRLRVAHQHFRGLTIRTTIIEGKLREHAIVQAHAEGLPVALSDDVMANQQANVIVGTGIGTADKKGDSRLEDSLLELAETRAISRALRAMGVGADMCSAEEMARNGIMSEMLMFGDSSRVAAAGLQAAPQEAPKAGPAEAAAKPQELPPAAKGRKEVWDAIGNHVGHDRKKQEAIMAAIIPGKTLASQLSDPELDIVKLVVKACVVIDGPQAIAHTKKGLQQSIGATTAVEHWTPAHVKAAWDKMGVNPQPGHSAASAEAEPPF